MIPNKTVAPGIYNHSFQQYSDLDAFNNSAGKWLDVSAAHCKAYQEGKLDNDTTAKAFGRIVHTAIFEPAAYKRIPQSPFDDFRTNDAKAWKKANPVFTTADQREDIQAIVRSIYAHKEAARLLNQPSGRGEVTLVAHDPEFDLLLKCRVDFLAMAVVDGKSTVNASPDSQGFPKQAAYLDYAVQQATYQHILNLLEIDYSGFLFLAFEKTPPYSVCVFEFDAAAVSKGAEVLHRRLETYAECRRNKAWPSYSEKVEIVSMPKWWMLRQPYESALAYELQDA